MPGSIDAGARRVARAAALLIALAASPAPGQPAQEAGFVESFAGPASGYAIERAGARTPVALLAPVYAGDRLSVLADSGRLELRLSDGRQLSVSAGEPPLEVGSPPADASVSMNVVRWLGDWVEGRSPGDGHEGVSLVTRAVDAPLASQLFAAEARLPAGARDALRLAWQGGRPPFRLSLAAGERVLDERAGLYATHVALGPLALEPGRYQLRLEDALGDSLQTQLVIGGDPPAVPDGVAATGVGEPLRSTLAAAWLAGREPGWRLEAYQRAAALPDYPPAEALCEALVAGEAPPDLTTW